MIKNIACSIDLLSLQSPLDSMSEKKTDDTAQMRKEIKSIHKKWYDNKLFFIASLILAPATFVGGFLNNVSDVLFYQNHPVWQSSVVAVFFVLSVGFFVVVFSYLFNVLWLAVLREKKEEKK